MEIKFTSDTVFSNLKIKQITKKVLDYMQQTYPEFTGYRIHVMFKASVKNPKVWSPFWTVRTGKTMKMKGDATVPNPIPLWIYLNVSSRWSFWHPHITRKAMRLRIGYLTTTELVLVELFEQCRLVQNGYKDLDSAEITKEAAELTLQYVRNNHKEVWKKMRNVK